MTNRMSLTQARAATFFLTVYGFLVEADIERVVVIRRERKFAVLGMDLLVESVGLAIRNLCFVL